MKDKLEEQLLVELSRRNIELVSNWILDNPGSESLLVDLVISHKPKVAERASWVMEKISDRLNGFFDPYLPRILEVIQLIPSSSTRRTLAKVLMLHTIPEDYEGKILDFCITAIESPKEPVAVKANCMTIVFNLLPKYPDLRNEVYAIIESQLPHNSIGFKARFKVLRTKLEKA